MFDSNIIPVTRTAVAALLLQCFVNGAAVAQLPLPTSGVITQSGVYYLQQDLLLTRDTGINIQANNVVLNLNGFAIRYVGTAHPNSFGIVATNRSNLRITNGKIGGYWFNIHTSQNQGLQVDHMIFDDNPYIGINAASSTNVHITDNTFSNFRYDIPKSTDQYLIGVNIGAADAVVSRNRFDAVYSGSTPNAPGVETVCVLFSADVSKRSVVSDNQMVANVPLDRSYGLWIASNARVTATRNTIENMRYGVTLATDGVGLAGYNDFSMSAPPPGTPALPSTFGVYALSAKQVFATGNTFQGQTHPTYFPPDATGDWNNADIVLPVTINNLADSLLPGVGYDPIKFPGTFTHGGLISIDLSEFVPGPVGEVKIVGWIGETGNRSNTGISFTGGVPLGYEFRSDGLYVSLAHILLGDYNGDEVVDGADYALWRKQYGTNGLYDTWRAHFGQAAGNGAAVGDLGSSSSVAEPTVGPMCLLFVMLLAMRRPGWAPSCRESQPWIAK